MALVTLKVELDKYVWNDMTEEQKTAWIDELVDSANGIGYVSSHRVITEE